MGPDRRKAAAPEGAQHRALGRHGGARWGVIECLADVLTNPGLDRQRALSHRGTHHLRRQRFGDPVPPSQPPPPPIVLRAVVYPLPPNPLPHPGGAAVPGAAPTAAGRWSLLSRFAPDRQTGSRPPRRAILPARESPQSLTPPQSPWEGP